MLRTIDSSFVADLVSTSVSKKNIYGAVLCVENGDSSLSLLYGAGNLSENKPYFIASVTKLYVTTVLLLLRREGYLQLENKISEYFTDEILHELHIYKGIDYSKDITIKHLMSNTSGIPDYFSSEAVKELVTGKDQSWGFGRVIASAKKKKPKFAPGKRAQYSDTNYQLLGRIIETITKKEIHTVFKEFIFDELDLVETYLFEDVNDEKPATMYYKDKELHLPQYMSSIGPEGGIVSTAKESMLFLKAFFNGQFFSERIFH
ncbi:MULTISPECIES: serine hydrolase domain-containing protein [Bacillus]|uniref:serine hydrolase domain-containing protein n=1 Tax=Bacillus TaxID=1386 RepID=UPI001D0D35CE|nr:MULTISPECIES: serine hydrolase domain-containing protein [Bacillus]